MLAMQSTPQPQVESARYAKCIAVSKRIRWDIDRDVIRERDFDFTKKFLPDGLSFVERLSFLGPRRAPPAVADPGARRTPTSSVWSSASSAPRCSR